MPVGSATPFLESVLVADVVKIGVFIILGLYAIFSLVILQQVNILSKSLITPLSPLIRAIFIVHAGLAVGLIFLSFGIL